MFTIFTAIAIALAFARAFDAQYDSTQRKLIADFIRGSKKTNLTQFEYTITNKLVGIMLDQTSRVSFWRVATMTSVLVTVAAIHLYSLNDSGEINYSDLVDIGVDWKFAYLILVGIVLSIPTDYISVCITKKLFYNKHRTVQNFVFCWVVDTCVSVALPGLIAVGMGVLLQPYIDDSVNRMLVSLDDPTDLSLMFNSLEYTTALYAWFAFILGGVSSIVASALISIGQILLLFLGCSARLVYALLIITPRISPPGLPVDKAPFTFLVLTFTPFIIALYAIIKLIY